MSRSRLLPSAKVVLYLNGQAYAAVVAFKWGSATPRRAAYGIDSGQPYELIPLGTKIAGSMTLLRLIGDGGAEGAGITTQLENIPAEKYFSMALIERSTDTQIFRADRCSVTDQSWDVTSKAFVIGTVSWEALDWNNEAQS